MARCTSSNAPEQRSAAVLLPGSQHPVLRSPSDIRTGRQHDTSGTKRERQDDVASPGTNGRWTLKRNFNYLCSQHRRHNRTRTSHTQITPATYVSGCIRHSRSRVITTEYHAWRPAPDSLPSGSGRSVFRFFAIFFQLFTFRRFPAVMPARLSIGTE